MGTEKNRRSSPYKNREVECICASDLVSDLLTIPNDKNPMLMTGLCNVQSMRTFEMSDVNIVLFARSKKITPKMIEHAEDNKMVLIETDSSMYKSSGILYAA